MTASDWFEDIPVLGAQPPEQVAQKLRELDERELAEKLLTEHHEPPPTFGKKWWRPFQDRAWQHTAHAFGHISPAEPGTEMLPIHHAGNIKPQENLKNARIKITLDCLRVAAYPGRGIHHILFDFYAQNQVTGKNVEHLHFNATYRAKEGERAAILGYPVFIGLNVGNEGVMFKCYTVNVKNESDEALLHFLDSDVFKAGLKLAKSAQPAIAPLSQMALGLTRSIASRNKNAAVQDFYMGLDFSAIPTRARLTEGSYIAVQIPEALETIWDWQDWVYNPARGQIVNKEDSTKLIAHNYLVFSVSRYEG
ncbi:MAG: hypothetical protein V2I97_17890 [Desulfococcaceae bacterium]|jgi:hypothetical protein|nr:hypothetical protein [Desulfococcaceae bacterium]